MAAPRTTVTVPTFLRDAVNGKLDASWLRIPDPQAHTNVTSFGLFVPVSYSMQAMHIAAKRDGVKLRTTGRYRSYDRQVQLFNQEAFPTSGRYHRSRDVGHGFKLWDSNGDGKRETWYLQTNPRTGNAFASAAVPADGFSPGSNHGFGLADDLAEDDSIVEDQVGESLDADDIRWLDDHQTGFGWALETPAEQWHRHWHNGDALPQLVVDTLYSVGVLIPDMSEFGFFVPDPSASPDPPPPEEDDMAEPTYLAYTDTREYNGTVVVKGLRQLWRGNGLECYSLGDPDAGSGAPGGASDAYGLVRRDFKTDRRVKGRYLNPGKTPDDPNAGEVYESADEIITISPNQVRLDLGTPRSPVG